MTEPDETPHDTTPNTSRNSAQESSTVGMQSRQIDRSNVFVNPTIFHGTDRSSSKWLSPPRLAAAVAGTAAVAVGLTVLAMNLSSGTTHSGTNTPATATPSTRTIANSAPRTASAAAPPVLVEGVGPLSNTGGSLVYAVQAALDMTPAELATFNADTTSTEGFIGWISAHNAIPVGDSMTLITLVGNIPGETVQITDVKVLKTCHTPTEATLVQANGGGDTTSTPLDFDLDQVEPYAQNPDYGRYFPAHTIVLQYNEPHSLAIGIHTSAECTFTFQLVVATPSGTLIQPVDDNGHPFEISSYRGGATSPFNKYQDVYLKALDDPNHPSWTKMDPAQIAGMK